MSVVSVLQAVRLLKYELLTMTGGVLSVPGTLMDPEMRYEYDASGKCACTRSSDGLEVRFEYNESGDLIRSIGSDGSESRYEYVYVD